MAEGLTLHELDDATVEVRSSDSDVPVGQIWVDFGSYASNATLDNWIDAGFDRRRRLEAALGAHVGNPRVRLGRYGP